MYEFYCSSFLPRDVLTRRKEVMKMRKRKDVRDGDDEEMEREERDSLLSPSLTYPQIPLL